jgi:amino acid adenylation domain-containing protein
MYGPTETTVWSTSARVGLRESGPAPAPAPSIGRPIANTRTYVLDPAGQPLPPRFPGELFIGGAGVARGYHRLPAETAARFLPDPFERQRAAASERPPRMYRTGDRARWTDDGTLEFLGRTDEQVKIRGHRVEPGEVEAALVRLGGVGVREAAVAVREIDGEPRLVAWVAAGGADHGAAPPTPEELQEALSAELPQALRPSRYVVMPALPRTPNGKLDRRSLPLPPPLSAGAGRRDAAQPPEKADALEAELSRVWCEVLRLESVGPDESFFDLGGHSLKAIQLVSLVSGRCGVDPPLATLFDAPSIRAFAAAVRRLSSAAASAEAGPGATVPPPRSAPAASAGEPRDRFEPFPLTETQQAYWIGRGDGFELGNLSTHTYVEVDVPHLDIARAQAALDQLIARHDMLRVRILADGRQQVLETVPPYRIEVLDLRGMDEEEVGEQLDKTRVRLSAQTIPSGRWPLFDVRASLLEGCVRVHLTVDHLAVDALSWRVLRRELIHAYRRPALPLPELAFTFREYVLETAGAARGGAYERARAHWEARLPALPAAPELPYARSFAEVRRPRMTRRGAQLSAAAWRRLKARARRAGVTGTGALLASFADVLAAWSREPRMTLNVPTFRRRPVHPQVNDVVGVFTSLALLETDGAGGSFEERARRIQRRLWEDLDHAEFSGVEAIREVARARGSAGSALFPVVFTSLLFAGETGPRERGAAGESSAEIVYEIHQAPQASLSAEVAEERGGLSYRLDAVEELFPPGLLDDFFLAWGAHLEALGRDATAWTRGPAETSEALLPPWQAEVRRAVNATSARLSDLRLEELFDAALERGLKGRTAVVAGGREMTYEELDGRAAALARRLAGLGVERGDIVAIAMEKGWEQAAAVLAILRAGAAYLPVEPELPRERLHYLLGNGGVRVALTTSAVRDRFAFPDGIAVVDADREPPAPAGSPRPPRRDRSPDDLAYVLYTSGSTGLPKGVAITHRGAVNTVLDVNERYRVGSDDRIFGISALGFDLSVWDLFGAFAAGGAVVLPDETALKDPAQWLEPIVEGRVTVWDSVPALLKLFLETAAERLAETEAGAARRMKLVLLSGDWTPVTLPAQIAATFPRARIVSMGGATEASIWSIAFEVDRVDPSWRSIPYGRPMKNQRFHVLDGDLAPRPVWTPGQLFIGGAGLAREYLGDPAKTRASFFPHPRTGERLYRTGDLGRYLPDGNIEFLGRDDHQVKVLGTRIELGEIEAALESHPAVASAVATARGEWNRHIHAYVVPRPNASPSARELRAWLEGKLPAPMIPEAFVRLAALPLTANGKVDRSRLPVPAGAADSGRAPAAPGPSDAGDPERAVAAGVAAILRVPALEPEDNLIDLGANSVDFIRIANLVEKATGRRPALHEIYSQPTVAAILRSGGAGGRGEDVPIVAVSRTAAPDSWEGAE